MIDVGADAALPDGLHDARDAFAARWLRIAGDTGKAEVEAVCRALALDGEARLRLSAHGERLRRRAPDRIAPCVLVPGLLGDSVRGLVAPMMAARRALRPRGFDIEVIWVNGRSGSSRNAARLRPRVHEIAERAGQPIHLVGYSKGCTDALHLLAEHPDTHCAVRSLTSLAGVVHGTPLASETPDMLHRLLARMPLPGLGRGDGRAIADLAPDARRRHLTAHPLPNGLRYASLVAAPTRERVSRVLLPSWRKLARIDPANDSQVIARDALLPRGELLGVLNADHWAIALPIGAQRDAAAPGGSLVREGAAQSLARAARRALGVPVRTLLETIVDRNELPRASMLAALLEHLSLPRDSS